MTREWWRGLPDMPRGYHHLLMPRLVEPWTQDLLQAADIRPGMRVLDVACGTGVVARHLASGVDYVGADSWDAMLHLAREVQEAPRAWSVADMERLPYRDGAFHRVVCQQGIQFAEDPAGAAGEMARVLAPRGRLTLLVWADLKASPGFAALRQAVGQELGAAHAPDVDLDAEVGSAKGLAALLENAGLVDVRVQRRRRILQFDSVAAFLRAFSAGSSLGEVVPNKDPRALAAVLARMEETLAPYVEGGALRFPAEAHVATGLTS